MAKISFSKLGVKVDSTVETFVFNDQEIEVKMYLPMEEKLALVSNVLNECVEDAKFYNPGKIEVYLGLNIMYFYTNISFTDKQKENPLKLYDLVYSSGLLPKIRNEIIPFHELNIIDYTLDKTINAIYQYNNSALGLMDSFINNYDELKFDIDSLREGLADPENIGLLRAIMDKLG